MDAAGKVARSPARARVAILGTGQMGAAIARLVLDRPGLALVGACARRPARAGLDLGRAIGLGRDLGTALSADPADMAKRALPEIAIQATCSRLADARGEIETLMRCGVHVISIAEELAYPWASAPQLADELHAFACERRVAVLGTGVNPGFVLDFLPIVLSGVCAEVRSITARRVNDLSPYGPTVLNAQGVGLDPEAFARGVAQGSVVGHIGFPQSLHMIAHALGWELSRIEERREPIVSSVRRETPFVSVAPGQVAGCLHTAIAYRGATPAITLIHPQQIHPQLEGVATGDSIEILGTPCVRLSGSPEIPGGQATAALAVNMIPRVLAAAPGLHSMADLPPAAALAGNARPTRRGLAHA